MSKISFVTRHWIEEQIDGFVLIDENVASQFISSAPYLVIPSGEKSKSLAELERCWEWLIDQGARPNSTVYGIGGGVVTDLAGFVASTLYRGVRFVAVPTTLLAMVDAAVGGKNGINLPTGKNLIGNVRSADEIWIDRGFLDSLSKQQYRSGLAEVIKYGVLGGEELLVRLEKELPKVSLELMQRCIEMKQHIVSHSNRDYLNFGHTLAHAIEAESGYQILHGEAVSVGMVYAMRLGEELGITPAGYANRIEALCEKVGLPIRAPSIEPLVPWMLNDKKRLGRSVRFVLCKKWGELQMQEVELCVK